MVVLSDERIEGVAHLRIRNRRTKASVTIDLLTTKLILSADGCNAIAAILEEAATDFFRLGGRGPIVFSPHGGAGSSDYISIDGIYREQVPTVVGKLGALLDEERPSFFSNRIQHWLSEVGVEPTTEQRAYVRFYRNSNNGEVIVESNATEVEKFFDLCGPAIINALSATEGDEEYMLSWALPAIFELACKLKGYKAERVLEQRVLVSGSVWPSEASILATDTASFGRDAAGLSRIV